jgi:shikimate 5-dehydrogenase
MLVHQGAEAFALWTGAAPPVEIMYAACAAILGGK